MNQQIAAHNRRQCYTTCSILCVGFCCMAILVVVLVVVLSGKKKDGS